MKINDLSPYDRRGSGWDGAPDVHDHLWGVAWAVLTLAGAALLLCGQTPIYRLALWVGGRL